MAMSCVMRAAGSAKLQVVWALRRRRPSENLPDLFPSLVCRQNVNMCLILQVSTAHQSAFSGSSIAAPCRQALGNRFIARAEGEEKKEETKVATVGYLRHL